MMAHATQRTDCRSDWPHIQQLDGAASRTTKRMGPDIVGMSLRVWQAAHGPGSAAEGWQVNELRMPSACRAERANAGPWHDRDAAMEYVDGDAQTLPRTRQHRLGELRWPRHSRLQGVGRELRSVLARHGAVMGAGADDRASRCERPLRASKLRLAPVVGPIAQSAPVLRVAQWKADRSNGLRHGPMDGLAPGRKDGRGDRLSAMAVPMLVRHRTGGLGTQSQATQVPLVRLQQAARLS